MKPSLHISKLELKSGTSIALGQYEKILIVGANNSGKSQLLRDITNTLQSHIYESIVAKVEFTTIGTSEDLKTFLDEKAERHGSIYRYQNWDVQESSLGHWDRKEFYAGLSTGFHKAINANERLTICYEQDSVAPGQQRSRPQQVLYDDDNAMYKISQLFKKAFGKGLLINYKGGSKIPFHVGNLPETQLPIDRISKEYVAAVTMHPKLESQGDGIKSYAGILFEAVVSAKDVTIIDEPEAFLHPPQMRKLGETLSSEVEGQLLVATHSSDILKGFLEGSKGKIRILRIHRELDITSIFEAPREAILELWQKPDMRYSNALEGIFHEQTILCEDDSDCRLINAVADHIVNSSGEVWKDTAYIPTGGKHAIPKIAKLLNRIGVPTKCLLDLDFLSDRSLVRETYEAFGGDWASISRQWEQLDAAVKSGIKPKTNEQIKSSIIEIINQSNNDKLPKSQIVEELKQGKEWSIIKKYGEQGFPAGDATINYTNLRRNLEGVGIFLVGAGEVENFHKSTPGHGPKFVTKLLSDVSLEDPDLSPLRDIVRRVHTGPHSTLPPQRE